VQGASAQDILHHLVAGQKDPRTLAALARGSLRRKQAELERALRGHFSSHHRGLVAELLTHLDFAEERIQGMEAQIEEQLQGMPGFPEAVTRLDTLPGVDRLTAITMVSEMGINMTQFPSAQHLCSWSGLAPGNNESGGKHRPAKCPPGNPSLRRTMTQAASSACKKKDSYLNTLYHRLAARRGKNRALVGVARTLLQAAYLMIQRQETYQDLGADYLDRVDRNYTSQRLVRRLEALGYAVKLQDQEEPMAA
jgi:transposase